ncbi:MAG TPA: gliding motility-associated C-terminal domain-containing protein [Chitinophagaceae bacterium]
MSNCKEKSIATHFFPTFLIFLFISASTLYAQQKSIVQERNSTFPIETTNNKFNFLAGNAADLFGIQTRYIRNTGQYGDTLANYGRMGKILYGYEGMGMPVLFTEKGVIHLQRKQKNLSYEEKEEMEKEGLSKEQIRKKNRPVDRIITFEWVNANPHPDIIAEDIAEGYHVYGLLQQKATAFRKIIYKDIYPGINAEYSFIQGEKAGYEFNLVIKPGADISALKIRYGGDTRSVAIDAKGQLIIKSDIGGISQSVPVCYYTDKESKGERMQTTYLLDHHTIRFKLPAGYTNKRALVIDPFVTATTSLSGVNNAIGKDIDFDYAGNVFVSGGGDASIQKLAKFSPTGTLLWTFTGSLTSPFWNFGGSYGGWVVDKVGGGVFLGQGLSSGFSVVRLDANGLYDNYITTPNNSFTENWKMIWSCNSGSPKILIAGGGGSANNELALLAPPATVPATSNLSGLTGGHNDISDIVIDPVSNEMFTIYSGPVNTGRDSYIYKHPPPYTSSAIAWQTTAGFFALREPYNRPYLFGIDNSTNTLAVNSNYLFYWDGVNLKAFNKATGAGVGTPLSFTSNTLLRQGGIFADECNNVFIGFNNGSIKVLKFTGSLFDDIAAPDITIAGFAGKAVYDLSYDNAHELLYACGNGFVASVDVSTYCPSTIYSIAMAEDCIALSATATVNPVPPAGTTTTYILFDGSTQLASNNTGIFTGLSTGINYTIKAFLNRACGGTQTFTNFMFSSAPPLTTHNPPAVCLPDGTADLTAAAITAGSTPGFVYSYWLDARGTIPMTTPTAAIAGTYYIKGTPATGCPAIKPVVVPSFPVPVAAAGLDVDICFGKNGQLNASGGIAYSWSPTTYLDNPGIANPTVINPPPGTHVYHVTITDHNGCRSLIDQQVSIIVATPPIIGIVRDTIVAVNQPLQLNATDVNNSGFINYVWTPTTGLNDPFISNPVAVLDRDIQYVIKATTINNCEAYTTVNVKVYKGPEIYVPTAFTPGSDGRNDMLKAIAVGMKEFHYFSIYNRWGQMVFTTKDLRIGWDGKLNGVMQGPDVFAWLAEAVDYKGNIIKRKGTVTLIR